MTHKETAEAYVRGKLPELMELGFGCEVQHKEDPDDHHFIFHCSESHPFLFVAKTDGTSGAYLDFDKREYKIIGHPIQLQHYARVFYECDRVQSAKMNCDGVWTLIVEGVMETITFDLTTGQPATEADYQAFNTIVGV